MKKIEMMFYFLRIQINSNMIGCDFCHELAKKQYTYCKDVGHTNDSCPKSLLKKQKEEERNKREEANEKVRKEEAAKANSWAAKVTKSIPSDVAAKIAEENRILAEQSEKKRAAEAAERKRIWENKCRMRMMTKYGLKKDFIMPHKLKDYPRYEFWYFGIEGTQDDKGSISEVAKKMRDDPTNREKFHAYLEEQYFVNWIYASEDTEDDCKYLSDLRYQKARDEECAYYKRLEQERLWVIEIEEKRKEVKREKKDMYAWVKSGRISQKVYDDWRISKHQEELEREEEFHNEGFRIGIAEIREDAQMALAEAQWKARKEVREKDKK
jgi:hypothetical protein